MKQRIPVRMMLHLVTIVAVEVSHAERIAMDKMCGYVSEVLHLFDWFESGLLQLR